MINLITCHLEFLKYLTHYVKENESSLDDSGSGICALRTLYLVL